MVESDRLEKAFFFRIVSTPPGPTRVCQEIDRLQGGAERNW